MRTPSTDLFDLISSMTPSERRYFTTTSGAVSGQTGYLRLFEVIAKQKEYDEERVIEECARESFVRNFSYAKNYLYRQILRSLRNFHAETSTSARLHDIFRSIEILADRGLHDQCSKLLKKAQKLVTDTEEYPHALQIVHWKNSLLRQRNDFAGIADHLAENSEMELLDDYRAFLSFGRLSQTAFLALRRPDLTRDRFGTIEDVLDDPLLDEEPGGSSFAARAWYHDLNALRAERSGQVDVELEHLSASIAWIEDHPERLAGAPRNYIASLTRYAVVAGRAEKENLFAEALEKLREFASSFAESEADRTAGSVRLMADSRADLLELSHLIESDPIRPSPDRIEAIGMQFAAIADDLPEPTRVDYLHNFALYHFFCGDHRSALRFATRIINESSPKVAPERYDVIRIFAAIIHLELGNLDLLESAVRSVRRYLTGREMTSPLTDGLLRYLLDVAGAITRQDRTEARLRFTSIVEDPDNASELSRMARFFDLERWLREK